MTALRETGQPYMLYTEKLPRLSGPFDANSKKWMSVEWAPALEDDPDPEYKGYK